MPSVGEYKYPGDLTPEDAEEWMDILVNGFGGTAEEDESFAKEVGHSSADSGSFRRKVADARKYGIMTPRGTLECTDLGKQLANPRDEEERAKVMIKMLKNIDLLEMIYDDLDGGTESEFWRVISRLTTANPKEARHAANDIEPLYETLKRAHERIGTGSKQGSKSEQNVTTENAENESSNTNRRSDDALFVRVDGDELRFSDLTEAKIDLVRDFLDAKKDEIGREEETSDEDDDGAVQAQLGN